MKAQAQQRMRIATWNLERPRDISTAKAEAIRKQMAKIDADIWVLTETHSELSPSPEFHGCATGTLEHVHTPGECRTAIWTRFPITSQIPTYDEQTAICIEVESPLGMMVVYGTIIPYGGAGTKYGYWFKGSRRTETKSWQLHYESINILRAEWTRLRREFPNHMMCIAGDFNQSRDGHRWGKNNRQWYGTNQGRELLLNALSDSGMKCVTEMDFVSAGQLTTKSTVDHICLSTDVAQVSETGAWEAGTVDGKRLTDHNGVWADI